ncbi:hypothetical protein A5320_04190 [Rheinheimera sp. SA_1]|uniref:hypothetical protein n=1 Tax=Rheinheimera sp. SA_1 TaxID=1827365 RepID=UPI0007FBC42B|nr:hypothetical protein [Rheinheimera sp. SA_1]OBP16602.1 hypothetical protein A5320_04190 [Rheinheimera sp. SA_1]
MKVFSWSGLVFVLSISFIWSCGYWLLLQSGSWQLLQQKNELTQQLDKAQTLLQNWQQGYQLHLAYLETELLEVQQLPAAGVESALVDPLQQLDEQIRRVLWPDPLLAYAVLDSQGRVLRLSSADASTYFSQTNFQSATAATFLPPLVLKDQWILPLQVDQQQQRLVLWFDASQLQQQLQRLMATPLQVTELLLLSKDAELLSSSRFQKSLLPRLGLDNQDPQQALKIYAKRPPENLLRSKQRYQDAGAWPLTSLMNEVARSSSGFIASHYLNYLGRQTLASYRQLPEWQLYLVVERDAAPMLEELASIKMRLLAALTGLSLLLGLAFYLIHRRLRSATVAANAAEVAAAEFTAAQMTEGQFATAEWADPNEHGFDSPVLGTLELALLADQDKQTVTDDIASTEQFVAKPTTVDNKEPQSADLLLTGSRQTESATAESPIAETAGSAQQPAAFPAAAALLQAWLQQPVVDPKLADISRSWLQQVTPAAIGQIWCSDIMLDLTAMLAQRHQVDTKLNYLLEASTDFPEALLVQQQRLLPLVQSLLAQTELRVGNGTLLVRLLLAETNQLRIEIVDQAHSLTDGQWLSVLNPVADDQSATALAYRHIQQQLAELHAHLSARADLAAGNKMVLTVPCEVPLQPVVAAAEPQPGSAMLLCPPGEAQQLYRRLFRQSGLDLLPMDDASQLLQWCESSPQELSKMLIDEDFVQSDAALAGKIAAVVRRYFPDVQVLLVVRQPQQWLSLAQSEQLFLLAKPLTPLVLTRAFHSTSAGIVTGQKAKIWLCQPDPLQYWWIEQQLHNLHYQVQGVTRWPELPGDLQQDYYCLPWTLHEQLASNQALPRFVVWCLGNEQAPSQSQLQESHPLWPMADGGAALSRHLYQITLQHQGSTTR